MLVFDSLTIYMRSFLLLFASLFIVLVTITGLANRDRIGMELITFEVDYPHADSTFPDTEKIATQICENAGLDDDEIYALMRGNAIRGFGLERFGITR